MPSSQAPQSVATRPCCRPQRTLDSCFCPVLWSVTCWCYRRRGNGAVVLAGDPGEPGTTGTRMYVRWFPGNGDAKRRCLRIPSLCTIRSPGKRRLTPGTPKSSAAMRLRSPNSGGGAMATYYRSSEDSPLKFGNPGGGPYHRALCATKRCAYFRCARLVRTDPRNPDGNPDSLQAVVFSTAIIDVSVGS